MRSIADTGKDGPIVHTAAAALVERVVLRHHAAASAAAASTCLTCGCGIPHAGRRSPD